MATLSATYVYETTYDMWDTGDIYVYFGATPLVDPTTTLTETSEATPEFDPNPGDDLMWGETAVKYVGYHWADALFQDPATGKYYVLSSEQYGDAETFVVWEKQYTDDPLPPGCFVKGSLIETSKGASPIENLRPGDKVKCLSGWREVKWLGWRTFGAAAFRTDKYRAAHCPVTIKAHAVDENVPTHDIRVSPWHHLFVSGLLIRAMDLLNGSSIVQDLTVREISYFHVELDQFDVMTAHGIYSESWADGGNRDFFQNVDVPTLCPEDQMRRRASRPGFDHLVIRGGKKLAAIRARIAKRADNFFSKKSPSEKVA
ncbi:Hint domain-containing protein [Bordetella tumulicola]|uniref:Hint domain-containing protein n=1 Tax=Bordetella tumulicola TaxID=1649133 RepID=UPI0039F0A63D